MASAGIKILLSLTVSLPRGYFYGRVRIIVTRLSIGLVSLKFALLLLLLLLILAVIPTSLKVVNNLRTFKLAKRPTTNLISLISVLVPVWK